MSFINEQLIDGLWVENLKIDQEGKQATNSVETLPTELKICLFTSISISTLYIH